MKPIFSLQYRLAIAGPNGVEIINFGTQPSLTDSTLQHEGSHISHVKFSTDGSYLAVVRIVYWINSSDFGFIGGP
jgi:hypothetical protein